MLNIFSKLNIFIVLAVVLGSVSSSCTRAQKGTSTQSYPSTPYYDVNTPYVVELPQALDEISGIAYYPKDTSVFAIIDEDGLLYKVPIMRPAQYQVWQFGKKNDYEDIVRIDTTLFVLESNGNVFRLNYDGEKFTNFKWDFGNSSKKANEFEMMYDAGDSTNVVIVCKQCENDSKSEISSYILNYKDTADFFDTTFKFKLDPLWAKVGDKKHLKASAIAINPITNEFYMVSSIQKLLVIFDRQGNFKEYYELNPKYFKQPEGITFTPAGDMIISNEFADVGFANLLIFKNKKK